jgi:hypothetical protein
MSKIICREDCLTCNDFAGCKIRQQKNEDGECKKEGNNGG